MAHLCSRRVRISDLAGYGSDPQAQQVEDFIYIKLLSAFVNTKLI